MVKKKFSLFMAMCMILSTLVFCVSPLTAKADGIIACYCGKGMAELPTGKSVSKQYNPNIPAAIYILFGGSNPTGKLPVKIN